MPETKGVCGFAIDPQAVAPRRTTNYPEPFRKVVAGREKRALGDAAGLRNFGVNLTRLEPGAASALRHWHEKQDEFVYVLEGELVLVTDEGETVLRPGMVAGFRAGTGNGHHLVNRSDKTARVLEVGTRTREEVAYYSDIDMMVRDSPESCDYLTKDGRPLK
jgi:uncharacterized cupin superfamily protein